MLHEIALGRDRSGPRARHGRAQGVNFRARGCGLQLRHGQPAADVIGEYRRSLQPEVFQGSFQLLRIAQGYGIDRNERRDAVGIQLEASRRAHGMQVGKHLAGVCPGRMSRQIGKRIIEFAVRCAAPLPRTAAAVGVQDGRSGRRLRTGAVGCERRDGHGSRYSG